MLERYLYLLIIRAHLDKSIVLIKKEKILDVACTPKFATKFIELQAKGHLLINNKNTYKE